MGSPLPGSCLFFPNYNWPFSQDHVIQIGRREIEHKLADPGDTEGTFRLRKTVVMVGMMGAGKTAVGRALAVRLGVPFLDSDAEIETAANMSIAEIFERDGEGFFRLKESQVIARLLAGAPGVLSTGGGAYLKPQNREVISRHGVAVCLKAEIDVLWARVRHRDTRPLLRTPDPYAALVQLYRDRAPVYAQAELTVVSDGRSSVEAMVDKVIAALLTRPDVLERAA